MLEKLKQFFIRIFKKQKLLPENTIGFDNNINIKNDNINSFKEDLNFNNEIYNLQILYENGKIIEDDLTIKQIKQLIDIYKKQISLLKN